MLGAQGQAGIVFSAGRNLEMEKSHMQNMKLRSANLDWAIFSNSLRPPFFWQAAFPARSMAQQPGQKTFSSAEDASNALVMAAQK